MQLSKKEIFQLQASLLTALRVEHLDGATTKELKELLNKLDKENKNA